MAASEEVLQQGQAPLPELCAPLIHQSINGILPDGTEKRTSSQARYDALLATFSDPNVADKDLSVTAIKRMREADPSLWSKPKVLPQPIASFGLSTAPLDARIRGTVLTFVCTIRNYGTGWKPFEIMISRKDSRSGMTVPLISIEERN